MTLDAVTPSWFGYSTGYGIVKLGSTDANRSLAFNVDVTGNPSGAFSGNGSEYVWRNAGSFITPNSINNGYNTLLSWSSSGVVTIANLVATSLSLGNSIQIGDYTGSPSLTFAAANNGINKINFYDQNNTEGLYLRTDGEAYGGTMTFGARWNTDMSRVVFKMYSVADGGAYDVRVGIGTDSPPYKLTLRGASTNYNSSSGIAFYDSVVTTNARNWLIGNIATNYGSLVIASSTAQGGVPETPRFTITKDGYVGIAIDSPICSLDVNGGARILNLGLGNAPTGTKLFANQDTAGEWIATFKNYGTTNAYGVSIDMSGSTSVQSAFQVYTPVGNGIRVLNSNGGLLVGTFTDISGKLVVKQPYTSATTPIYFGNTSYTAWNRYSYDTLVLQQDDVTSFRMVEKTGEANTSDQVLCFSIGDGSATIATSAQPLKFFVNGSPTGVTYQGLSGTEVLRLNTNGNAQFYGALTVSSTVESAGFVATSGGIAEVRLRGGGYGANYNTSLRSVVGAPGVLQMGNNADNYILAGNTAVGGYLVFKVNCTTETQSSGNEAMRLNSNTTALFASTVTAGGDVIAYSSSDRRLKDNIINIENGIDKIKKLNGVSFNWNSNQDTYEIGKKDYGVIAQDVEEIMPELVETRANGYKAVKYEKLISLLIEGIKEQQKQIDELKNK